MGEADVTVTGSWSYTRIPVATDSDIVVTKIPDVTSAEVGDVITWTIRVENRGEVPYFNLYLEDLLNGEIPLILDSGHYTDNVQRPVTENVIPAEELVPAVPAGDTTDGFENVETVPDVGGIVTGGETPEDEIDKSEPPTNDVISADPTTPVEGEKLEDEVSYNVTYSFVSDPAGMDLPKAVMDLLPEATTAADGETVTPEAFDPVDVGNGVWTFKGWTSETVENGINFVGTWIFEAEAPEKVETEETKEPNPTTEATGTPEGMMAMAQIFQAPADNTADPENFDLYPGETVEFTVSYTVTEDDVGTYLTNYVYVYDGPDTPEEPDPEEPVGWDPSTPVDVEEPLVSEISVQKTVSDRYAEVGDVIEYTITVENTGDTTLYDVRVSDPMMPGETIYVGTLESGETWSDTYEYYVTRVDEGETLVNHVVVTGISEDNTPVRDEDEITTDIDDEYTPRPPRPNPDDGDDDTTDIVDEEVPLAELPGLNTVDHFAYITGYEDGTVRPEGYISRAEVATIFFRLMTDEYRETYWSTSNLFTDVTVGSWYNNAISTTANVGWITGYPDDTYRPNNYITRAEFATIAARFLSEEYDGENMFTDIGGHWAAEYINRAARAGWITGYAGEFRPNDYITRAEAVTLINRMLDRAPDADHMLANMVRWPDNPETAWYYEAIQEATNSHDYDRETIIDFETWTELLPNRDWAALEEVWAQAGDAAGGEVADGLFPDGNDNN